MKLPVLFARFLGVGACGFVVDAGLFQLMFAAGGGHIVPRLISASIAITLTWYLNRRLVFRTQQSNAMGSEYGRYVAVQVIGLLVNLVVYFMALAILPVLRNVPVMAIALGAAAALLFNFLGARCWAFRTQKEP